MREERGERMRCFILLIMHREFTVFPNVLGNIVDVF
jgi:hypothetical protein